MDASDCTMIVTIGATDGANSDPMMALVPPKEQYNNYYTFTTPAGVSAPYRYIIL